MIRLCVGGVEGRKYLSTACHNLVASGEYSDSAFCLIEKKRPTIYILLYHVGKHVLRQCF